MNYEEMFPTDDENSRYLLSDLSRMREYYDTLDVESLVRYGTLIAKLLSTLFAKRPLYRAHVVAPLFGRDNIRCDCMWSELLFCAVDTGQKFLREQTEFEKQPNGPLSVSEDERKSIHGTARRVIGLLYFAIEQIRSHWKGLRPSAFQSLGAPQYDLTQLVALHRWVQAYGLWNRGFLAMQTKDMESASIFRTCAHILQQPETRRYIEYASASDMQKLVGGNYQKMDSPPPEPKASSKPPKHFARVNWYTWARTEWLVVAANQAGSLNNLPQLLGAVRLLYINKRPNPDIPLQLWRLEERATTSFATTQDEGVLLKWFCDRYPLLDGNCQMKMGISPLESPDEERSFVFAS